MLRFIPKMLFSFFTELLQKQLITKEKNNKGTKERGGKDRGEICRFGASWRGQWTRSKVGEESELGLAIDRVSNGPINHQENSILWRNSRTWRTWYTSRTCVLCAIRSNSKLQHWSSKAGVQGFHICPISYLLVLLGSLQVLWSKL